MANDQSMVSDCQNFELPSTVGRAAADLFVGLLHEVDVRCKEFEARWQEELKAKVSAECAAGLEALTIRMQTSHYAALAEQEERQAQAGTQKEPNFKSATVRSERSQPAANDCPEQLLPHLCREEPPSRRQPDHCISELRDLCEQGLATLSARLDQAVEGIEHVDSASIEDVRAIYSRHERLTEEALQEQRSNQEELRSQVEILKQYLLHKQADGMQNLKDQILNLSMRVSELAMCSDRDMLQSISEEYKEEAKKQMQGVLQLEQLVASTAQSGHSALQQLTLAQSNVEQRIGTLQRRLQVDFHRLLDELHRQQIQINVDSFKSMQSLGPLPENGNTSINSGKEDGCATM